MNTSGPRNNLDISQCESRYKDAKQELDKYDSNKEKIKHPIKFKDAHTRYVAAKKEYGQALMQKLGEKVTERPSLSERLAVIRKAVKPHTWSTTHFEGKHIKQLKDMLDNETSSSTAKPDSKQENIYENYNPDLQNQIKNSTPPPSQDNQPIYANAASSQMQKTDHVYGNIDDTSSLSSFTSHHSLSTDSLADSGIDTNSETSSLNSFSSTDSLDSITSDGEAEPIYANVKLNTTSSEYAEVSLGMPTEIPPSPLAPPPEKPSANLKYTYSPDKPAVSKAEKQTLCKTYSVNIRTVMVNGSPVGYIISNKRAEGEKKPTTLLIEAHGGGVFADGSKIPEFTTPDSTTFLMPARRNETFQVNPWAQADAISKGQIDFDHEDQIYGDVDSGSGREMTNYYLSPITTEQGASYDLNLEKTAQLMQFLKKSSTADGRGNDFNMLMLDPNLQGHIPTEDLMGAFKQQGIDYKHIIMNVCRPQTKGTVNQTTVESNIQRDKNLSISEMGKRIR